MGENVAPTFSRVSVVMVRSPAARLFPMESSANHENVTVLLIGLAKSDEDSVAELTWEMKKELSVATTLLSCSVSCDGINVIVETAEAESRVLDDTGKLENEL